MRITCPINVTCRAVNTPVNKYYHQVGRKCRQSSPLAKKSVLLVLNDSPGGLKWGNQSVPPVFDTSDLLAGSRYRPSFGHVKDSPDSLLEGGRMAGFVVAFSVTERYQIGLARY